MTTYGFTHPDEVLDVTKDYLSLGTIRLLDLWVDRGVVTHRPKLYHKIFRIKCKIYFLSGLRVKVDQGERVLFFSFYLRESRVLFISLRQTGNRDVPEGFSPVEIPIKSFCRHTESV